MIFLLLSAMPSSKYLTTGNTGITGYLKAEVGDSIGEEGICHRLKINAQDLPRHYRTRAGTVIIGSGAPEKSEPITCRRPERRSCTSCKRRRKPQAHQPQPVYRIRAKPQQIKPAMLSKQGGVATKRHSRRTHQQPTSSSIFLSITCRCSC